MSFRLNEPVIDDDNFHSVVQPGGYGLVPRDMSAHPTGSLDGCVTYGAIKDEIPLVPWSDMPTLIAEKVAKKTLTSDIRLAMPGGPFTNLDQGNSNFCWAYASTHAMMICRMLASLPTIYLSGHAVGYKIKGGRNQGGWSAHSAEFIMKNGVPSVNAWPAQSWSSSLNNDTTWNEAKKYRFAEGFIDLDAPEYDRDLSFQQLLTLLIWNIPCPIDLNWWGHAILAVDPVDAFPNLPATDPSRYGVRILNSWKNWGDRGMGVLTKSKARPDNACGMRAPLLSS
jgi:hypothetical protein